MLFVFLLLILTAFFIDLACCITTAKESQDELYFERIAIEKQLESLEQKNFFAEEYRKN